MSKVKSRYWNFINSEDYQGYYLDNTARTHQNEQQDVYLQDSTLPLDQLRKRLKERFKRFQKHA